MPTINQYSLLDKCDVQGFDRTYASDDGVGVRVGCSQCQASVINGIACHETGCPNEVHECHGCCNIVPRGVKYCSDCQ